MQSPTTKNSSCQILKIFYQMLSHNATEPIALMVAQKLMTTIIYELE